MTYFLINSKKPAFGAHSWPFLIHFPSFGGKKDFSRKFWPCHVQLHMGFQHQAKIQKKTNDTNPRKRQAKGRKDRQEDGQTLFHRTLTATAGGPISPDPNCSIRLASKNDVMLNTQKKQCLIKHHFHLLRVLAKPYLMTLYVIFPIQVNFPISSRCVNSQC